MLFVGKALSGWTKCRRRSVLTPWSNGSFLDNILNQKYRKAVGVDERVCSHSKVFTRLRELGSFEVKLLLLGVKRKA